MLDTMTKNECPICGKFKNTQSGIPFTALGLRRHMERMHNKKVVSAAACIREAMVKLGDFDLPISRIQAEAMVICRRAGGDEEKITMPRIHQTCHEITRKMGAPLTVDKVLQVAKDNNDQFAQKFVAASSKSEKASVMNNDSPLDVVRRIRTLANDCGGMEELRSFVDELINLKNGE